MSWSLKPSHDILKLLKGLFPLCPYHQQRNLVEFLFFAYLRCKVCFLFSSGILCLDIAGFVLKLVAAIIQRFSLGPSCNFHTVLLLWSNSKHPLFVMFASSIAPW